MSVDNSALKAIRSNPSISRCYPKEYSFDKGKEGDFNAQECGAIYAELIKDNKVAEHLPLTYGQHFVAFSGIYYTFNFLQIDQTPTQTNLAPDKFRISLIKLNREYEIS